MQLKMNFISLPRPEHSTKVKISVISMFHSKNWTMISLDSRFGNVRPDKEQQKHLQVGIYELQPKFSAVESSIRDIFFFGNRAAAWKTIIHSSKIDDLELYIYILNIDHGPYNSL